MFLSVLDIFKIGIGPSSSHTMGPMVAGRRFLAALHEGFQSGQSPAHVTATLYGSLAFTGKGHATDRAVALGLLDLTPASPELDHAEQTLDHLSKTKHLAPAGLPRLRFDPQTDIVFDYGDPLPGHPNGMVFEAFDQNGASCLREIYYSIGGGFIATDGELEAMRWSGQPGPQANCPHPFDSAASMLEMGEASGKSIAAMKRENELCFHSASTLDAGIDAIWKTMDDCIERGMRTTGELPGGLKVRRRAASIRESLEKDKNRNALHPHAVHDWVSVYAMAVNEENAAGGRVVTSPTNGAAGVLPAVLRYYLDHCIGADPGLIPDFILTAAAVGGLIKHNASVSGAEVGCQGEVGSASAMAAAGLCAVLGGTNAQIENAAEIALEHHLGMTCDPVRGLVQVPCIERNGMGAVKAIAAASLALRGDGVHITPLDSCIETMRQTGLDMHEKYKETSLGGLAVNLPEC
ncbi:MAG: L-serine ammonia-lyase [Pseudomonadota bacterium]